MISKLLLRCSIRFAVFPWREFEFGPFDSVHSVRFVSVRFFGPFGVRRYFDRGIGHLSLACPRVGGSLGCILQVSGLKGLSHFVPAFEVLERPVLFLFRF
jgi:hypothetical protein